MTIICVSPLARRRSAMLTALLTTLLVAVPELTLTRLDGGGEDAPTDLAIFSDTGAFDGVKRQLKSSAYLIKHGDQYLLWDTGIDPAAKDDHGVAVVKTMLTAQLAQLGVTPEQISLVGISHNHGDHLGQARAFPKATLLIGQGDWQALTASTDADERAQVEPWLNGHAKVEPVSLDKDVFGDGTVVMLRTPGHTAGHHSLLVRLKGLGPVVLTGDLAIVREGYATNEVPSFNESRADSLASLDRIKRLAAKLKATVIIQHDVRDIAKLPAFPNAAK
jgi:N-acyl homoserine lactone hydrolase